MRHILLITLLSCLTVAAQAEKVGLVLSGGGAKGMAHIGLIKALEENDIPIDYVVGTSMGAIVGSLYVMGYTTEEMAQLMLSEKFRKWYGGEPESTYRFYFKQNDPTPSLTSIRLDRNDSIFIVRPQRISLVNPLQMNLGFVDIYAGANAACSGDFDKLMVPFRTVGSDVYNKKTVVMYNGDLGNAVRASMSFPFVFKPIKINGVMVYDGGIFNNYPYQVMIDEFNPDFIIGSLVSGPDPIPEDDDLYGQLRSMIIQDDNYNLPGDRGISIDMDLRDVKLMDFQRAYEVMARGYEYGITMVDSIKSRIASRRHSEVVQTQRENFKSGIPDLIFKDVQISGVTKEQSDFYVREFKQENGFSDTYSYEDLKKGYFKLLSDNNIKEIIPNTSYNRNDSTYSLLLDLALDDKPMLHVGGGLSTSATSQIYAGASYAHIGRISLDYLLEGQVGRVYKDAQFTTRLDFARHMSQSLSLKIGYYGFNYYNQKYIFNNSDNPAFNKCNELFVKIKAALPFLKESKAEFSVGGALDNDYFTNSDNISNFKYDISRYKILGGTVKFIGNTLNAVQYPTSGYRNEIKGGIYTSQERYFPRGIKALSETHYQSWLQMSMSSETYARLADRFVLGNYIELFYSSRNFSSNYSATIMQAGRFEPTANSRFVYNKHFRANQYMAYGIKPIYIFNRVLHFRGEFYGFMPISPICCDNTTMKAYNGKAFSQYALLGEISVVFKYDRISANAFVNSSWIPGHWETPSFGITLGMLLPGERFFE